MVEGNLRIPVVHGDLFEQLLSESAWRSQAGEIESAFEVETLANVPIFPGWSVQLQVHSIGAGAAGRSLAIEIAPVAPTVSERVAARGLLRALASGSTDRQRLLHACLVRIYVTRMVESADGGRSNTPVAGAHLAGALARGTAPGASGLWRSLTSHLAASRPDSVLTLRDAGGAVGMGGQEGFATIKSELEPEKIGQLETELANAFAGGWFRSPARRGYARSRRLLDGWREQSIARFLSTQLRFGSQRRRYSTIPKKLREGELAVNFIEDLEQLRAAFASGLVPAEPGVYLDLTPAAGDLSPTAFAQHRLGADALSAYATAYEPARRANFLLVAVSALIAGSAGGVLDRP